MTPAQRLAVLFEWLPASGQYRHIVLDELKELMVAQIAAWTPALCKSTGRSFSDQRTQAERAVYDAVTAAVADLANARTVPPPVADFYGTVFRTAKQKLAAH